MAAASVGVASPKKIAPSTDMISSASGKKLVSSAIAILSVETLRCSIGSLGARDGFIAQRIIT